jgi:hypothetical protein
VIVCALDEALLLAPTECQTSAKAEACACLQRFNFQYASSSPPVRHPSVIPVGPLGGMEMLIT